MVGTRTEMERLLQDAEKLTGIKYDINNLDDIYNAIHAIQQELKITGTTEREATETLLGSISMLKASWQNFLSGSGNLSTVVESASTAFKQIMKIVNQAIPDIVTELTNSLPELAKLGMDFIGQIGQGIIDNLPQLMDVAGQIGMTLLNTLRDNGPQLIDTGVEYILDFINGLSSQAPEIMETATEIAMDLIVSLADHLPEIIETAINLRYWYWRRFS